MWVIICGMLIQFAAIAYLFRSAVSAREPNADRSADGRGA